VTMQVPHSIVLHNAATEKHTAPTTIESGWPPGSQRHSCTKRHAFHALNKPKVDEPRTLGSKRRRMTERFARPHAVHEVAPVIPAPFMHIAPRFAKVLDIGS
jgi:hypothetical protein